MTARKSNTKSKDFYVYLHRKATNGEVFYVGKGHGRRAFSNNRRSKYWENVFKKHGVTVELYSTGLQEWYAFELEKELIAYYGRENLCNLTDGGEGANGAKRSNEVKIKVSMARKGKKLSDDHKQKLSIAKKGKKQSEYHRAKSAVANLGKKLSYETKNKISKANSIAVFCSNGMKFSSTKNAEKWLRKNGFEKAAQSAISLAARGIYKKAYGYTWTYEK